METEIDFSLNGELCIDNMQILAPPKEAFVDPLTRIWSLNKSKILQKMKEIGLKSFEHSQNIVNSMKEYRYFEDNGLALLLDTGEIKPYESIKNIVNRNDDLRFYTQKDSMLLDICVINFYRHMNVGVYYYGMTFHTNKYGEVNHYKNYMFKSRMIEDNKLPYFLYMESSRILDGFRSDQITWLLSKFVKPGGLVININADIGITTISFCNSFFLISLESDPVKYSMLRYNCEIAEVPHDRFIVYNGSKLDDYTSDLIFCDPTLTNEGSKIPLMYQNKPLKDFVLKSLKQTRVFVVKSLECYDNESFVSDIRKNRYQVYTYGSFRKGSNTEPLFYLHFILKRKNSPAPKEYISLKLLS